MTISDGVVVGDAVLGSAAVFQIPTGIATEGVLGAVEGAGEVRGAVGVEIIFNSFGGDG
jgi:hypothetical protein